MTYLPAGFARQMLLHYPKEAFQEGVVAQSQGEEEGNSSSACRDRERVIAEVSNGFMTWCTDLILASQNGTSLLHALLDVSFVDDPNLSTT